LPGRKDANKPPLSNLEHEAMRAVWEAGPCSVEAVHAALSRSRELKEVTTRTILRRLEQKGYVVHDVAGRAYIYRAVEAPRSLAAKAVRQIIDRLCNGSVAELVSGLVEARVLSNAELDALEASVRTRPRRRAAKSRKGR
jgi:predicted transcriptional regulator